GAFLRETFASEGYEDYESYGVKAGLAVALSKNAYLGAALVQEYYGNCTWQKECSQSYPEIVISFMF
ncbi:hypothetical protein KKC15_10065, partial [bacterium]|nr:hypothetical protein [bacterium]